MHLTSFKHFGSLSHKTQIATPLNQINSTNNSSAFHKKWTKWAYFLAYSHFNNFFVTQSHIPAIFNFQTWFYHTTLLKSPAFKKPIFKVLKPNRKLFLFYCKTYKSCFTSVKKANVLLCLGTLSCLTEN